jgi:hypothetical protein
MPEPLAERGKNMKLKKVCPIFAANADEDELKDWANEFIG